jgi:predicted CopG family antitoxin
MMKNCTILVRTRTREKLKNLGKKAQTYDDLINELIKGKRHLDDRSGNAEVLGSSVDVEDTERHQMEAEDKKMIVGERHETLVQHAPGGLLKD